jgi:hypothetical protein
VTTEQLKAYRVKEKAVVDHLAAMAGDPTIKQNVIYHVPGETSGFVKLKSQGTYNMFEFPLVFIGGKS